MWRSVSLRPQGYKTLRQKHSETQDDMITVQWKWIITEMFYLQTSKILPSYSAKATQFLMSICAVLRLFQPTAILYNI